MFSRLRKHHLMNYVFSSENVDMVGRRERFMQSNFESLSAAELDVTGNHINNTISNQVPIL